MAESRTYLEQFWDYLYKDLFGENDYNFSVFGTSLWMGIMFYGLCGIFTLADLTGRPKWMHRYKVQPGVNEPIDRQKLWKTFKISTFNQLVISGPWLVLIYYAHVYMGSSCKTEDLPSLGRVIRDLTVCVLWQELSFYYLHRLFHWGPLYRRVHKLHHEWQAPAGGLTAVYAHPLEHIIVNLPSFTLGPVIVGAHRFTTLLWYTRAMTETIVAHSGYHLPFTMSPEFHDYHHLKFNCNYGVYGWLDRWNGTDKIFRGSIQKLRHQILTSFTPLVEQHPNPKTQRDKNE